MAAGLGVLRGPWHGPRIMGDRGSQDWCRHRPSLVVGVKCLPFWLPAPQFSDGSYCATHSLSRSQVCVSTELRLPVQELVFYGSGVRVRVPRREWSSVIDPVLSFLLGTVEVGPLDPPQDSVTQ